MGRACTAAATAVSTCLNNHERKWILFFLSSWYNLKHPAAHAGELMRCACSSECVRASLAGSTCLRCSGLLWDNGRLTSPRSWHPRRKRSRRRRRRLRCSGTSRATRSWASSMACTSKSRSETSTLVRAGAGAGAGCRSRGADCQCCVKCAAMKQSGAKLRSSEIWRVLLSPEIIPRQKRLSYFKPVWVCPPPYWKERELFCKKWLTQQKCLHDLDSSC